MADFERLSGKIYRNSKRIVRTVVERIKGFFRLFSSLSDRNPRSGLPMIIPHAIMLSTEPASVLDMPYTSIR
jgi:hypothetical protein